MFFLSKTFISSRSEISIYPCIHASTQPPKAPTSPLSSQTPYPHFLAASAFIPCCTQARLFSACSFIFAGSLANSFIRCGSGTCRPFSTPGRCNMRSSHAFRAGNSSMLTPDQKAPVTHLFKRKENLISSVQLSSAYLASG